MNNKVLIDKTRLTTPFYELGQLQFIVNVGYFTLNNVPYYFSEDTWTFDGEILYKQNEVDRILSFKFDMFSNEDIKLKMKLWIYVNLNPYNRKKPLKILSLVNKFYYLKKSYSFIKSIGLEHLYINPTLDMVDAFKAHLEKLYSCNIQKTSCHEYLIFLNFIQDVWHIKQEQKVLDKLSEYDKKRLALYEKARIINAIPYDFYQRLYNFCIKGMDDENMKIEFRIVCAVIIMFTQTGLRRTELYSMELQPINSLVTKDDNGNPVTIDYVYAYITKTIRGSDTKALKEKIPLSKDCKKAFNKLIELCEDARKQLGWNKLIVFPKRCKKTTYSLSYNNHLIRFFMYYNKELDTINTQDKYPQLRRKKIKDFLNQKFGREIYEKVKEYGDNAVLVYPIACHYRKTFGTILYQNGQPIETISKLLHHQSVNVTETYYIRPFFSQKDFVRTKQTYDAILKHKGNVLGKKSADFTKRMKEYIEKENLASICKSDEEFVEYMSKNHPLHAKEVGFCLLSDIYPCTARSNEERLMCAFNTCPNIGFMFYDVVDHYQQMKNYETAIKLNMQMGLEMAAKKEKNRLKYLVKTFLMPEIMETEREILKHGKKNIIQWFPKMESILDRFHEIKQEVQTYAKEVVA